MKNRILKKRLKREKIHRRIRKRIHGTAERPRLAIYRSLNHIYAQAIDDMTGHVLVAVGSVDAEGRVLKGLKARAEYVGSKVAEKMKEKEISAVVFDRGGRVFHGNIKVLAEQVRSAKIQF